LAGRVALMENWEVYAWVRFAESAGFQVSAAK